MTVAALAVSQLWGVTPTVSTVTTPRMSTTDSNAPANTYPIPLPAAGLNYSYWMSLALTITNIQDATLLNNHKLYMDGACGWNLGTSGELNVGLRDSGDNGCPEVSYQQALGTEGTTGYDLADDTNGHAYYKSQVPEEGALDGYTSGAPLTVDSGDHTIAEQFNHVVLQCVVDTEANGAVRGAQVAETVTFQYDEI